MLNISEERELVKILIHRVEELDGNIGKKNGRREDFNSG